jgi:8-oxo-dGTP pyrophosphatase MutT (NUDIX family)
LEVLLVRRHSQSEVLGGAYVFPGGKLDETDCQVNAAQLDCSPAQLHHGLGQEDLDLATAAGLHVAALRETFEECGLLLHETGRPPAEQFDQRQALGRQLAQGRGFLAAMAELGLLPLQTRHIRPWSRWISPLMPSMSKRRFDTRFFIALAPMHQEAHHDAHEITEALWLRPEQAIRQYWAGQMMLANVQLLTLMELARIPSARQALELAAQRRPMLIQPEPHDIDGQRVVCYPGDPKHPVRQAAWRGPTRMTYRNGRFEPDGGLQALLD